MKKILVPTDFSNQANAALKLATQLARTSDAEVVLLSVMEVPYNTFSPGGTSISVTGSPVTGSSMDNVFIVQLHDKTKRQLEDIVNREEFNDINISYKLMMGSPYHSISEEITHNEVNLVIMGTKGISGIEEVLIGSNTEKVVRNAKCPVLTVKDDIDFSLMKDIVFASNFTEDQPHVVKELLKLKKLLNAKLHLVKVNTPGNFLSSRQMQKQMDDFVKKYELYDYTINVYNDSVEEDGIIYFAEDINADLIALATHGRTGFMHLLSGSIAEDVVNHSKRPVWTYTLKKN